MLYVFSAVILAGAATLYYSGGKSPLVYPEKMTGVLSLEENKTKVPNIILINADDLGFGDIGINGAQAIRTPNIDSLAHEGIKFTDFSSSDALCSQSRAGLLTGRYAKRMRLDFPLLPKNSDFKSRTTFQFGRALGALGFTDVATEEGADGLNQAEITIAKALKSRNYKTALIGKWHLGDYVYDSQYNPVHLGFDYHFGVPYSNDMHPFSLYRNLEQLEAEISDQSKLTGIYTEESQKFIVDSAKEGSPFFLYLAYNFPHRPLHASENYRHKSKAGVYGDSIEEIDGSVGAILKTLEEHKLSDNTLVIFTSDNGAWYEGSVGSFRGRKGQSYEGGFRVPFLAKFPGHIKPGSVCKDPAMNIDLFPTILSLAGIHIPQDRIIDGKDITGLLTQEDSSSADRFFYYYHLGTLEAVKWGKWKYITKINNYVWPAPINKKRGSMNEHTTGPEFSLHDLSLDPGESYNIADEHPEVLAKLQKAMSDWEKHMEENELGVL